MPKPGGQWGRAPKEKQKSTTECSQGVDSTVPEIRSGRQVGAGVSPPQSKAGRPRAEARRTAGAGPLPTAQKAPGPSPLAVPHRIPAKSTTPASARPRGRAVVSAVLYSRKVPRESSLAT